MSFKVPMRISIEIEKYSFKIIHKMPWKTVSKQNILEKEKKSIGITFTNFNLSQKNSYHWNESRNVDPCSG